MNAPDYPPEHLSFLKQVLSPQRVRHSVEVMQVMADLAAIYDLDRVSAKSAGLLHDAAKDLPPERQLALAEEAGLPFTHPCDRHPVYLHAPVGAYFISKELAVTDTWVLEAIAAHSFTGNGKGADATLARCLRAADILAPLRAWTGMKKLRSVVYGGRLEEAALLQSGWLIEYFGQIGVPVHPRLKDSFDRLSAKLKVNQQFFDRW